MKYLFLISLFLPHVSTMNAMENYGSYTKRFLGGLFSLLVIQAGCASGQSQNSEEANTFTDFMMRVGCDKRFEQEKEDHYNLWRITEMQLRHGDKNYAKEEEEIIRLRNKVRRVCHEWELVREREYRP